MSLMNPTDPVSNTNPEQPTEQVPTRPLKAPFPWFGGKSKVADLVWPRLGDVRNYIEPCCGSAAMLLLRPHAPQIETINDKDCFVANFWRATQADPDAVVSHCDYPVNEVDLHARHRWLVLSDDAAAFRERMRRDPDYFDPKIAGWWVWGQCCWIGGGWCNTKWQNAGFVTGRHADGETELRRPGLPSADGIHAKRPDLQSLKGVAKLKAQMPDCAGDSKGRGIFKSGKPVNLGSHDGRGTGVLKQQLPDISGDGATGRGIHSSAGHTRQPHQIDSPCEQRRQWLLNWFATLRDRLRLVRVCSGDWHRVCGSRSTTTRIGVTGVFFDPPYLGEIDGEASRDTSLYAEEDPGMALQIQQYCLTHGSNPRMRIALCGYEGEHNILEQHGWTKVAWRSQGGYGNRNKNNRNRGRERIWFSPYCL